MSKKQKPNGTEQARIVIANDLRSGLTVYLTESGTWSASVTDAMIVSDADGETAAMQTAVSDEAANKVTGAYLTDSNSCGEPVDLREMLRVRGPSINYLPPGAAVAGAFQATAEG